MTISSTPLAASMRRTRSSGRPALLARRSRGFQASGGAVFRGLGVEVDMITTRLLPGRDGGPTIFCPAAGGAAPFEHDALTSPGLVDQTRPGLRHAWTTRTSRAASQARW